MLASIGTYAIYGATAILCFSVGVNEIVLFASTLHGTRTCAWKVIVLLGVCSVVRSVWLLHGYSVPSYTSALDIFEIDAAQEPQLRLLGMAALACAVVTSVAGLLLALPTALMPAFHACVLGFLLQRAPPGPGVLGDLGLLYVGVPGVAALGAWLVARVLAGRQQEEAQQGNQFNRTLRWCTVVYPLTVTVIGGTVLFRQVPGLLPASVPARAAPLVAAGLSTALCLGAVLFTRTFLTAWLKRRVFLLYPQECAQYLKTTERAHEARDREARGLGPGTRAAPALGTALGTGLARSGSSRASTLPLGADGQAALNARRSEELFRPALVLIALFVQASTVNGECLLVLAVLQRVFNGPVPAFSPHVFLGVACVAMAAGRLTLSRRVAETVGARIIVRMRPSQAFAAMLGVLLALVSGRVLGFHAELGLGVLVTCLVAALAAVGGASLTRALDVDAAGVCSPAPSPSYAYSTESLAVTEHAPRLRIFRHTLLRIGAYWGVVLLGSLAVGLLVGRLGETWTAAP